MADVTQQSLLHKITIALRSPFSRTIDNRTLFRPPERAGRSGSGTSSARLTDIDRSSLFQDKSEVAGHAKYIKTIAPDWCYVIAERDTPAPIIISLSMGTHLMTLLVDGFDYSDCWAKVRGPGRDTLILITIDCL